MNITPTKISAVALTVSVLSVMFGSYFSAVMWAYVLDRDEIDVSVVSVYHVTKESPEQEIRIPQNLQESTERAMYFRSLDSIVKRADLEEIVEFSRTIDVDKVRGSLESALNHLQDENISNEQVKQIWGDLGASAKATLFAVRTIRLGHEYLRDPDSWPEGSLVQFDTESMLEVFLAQAYEQVAQEALRSESLGVTRESLVSFLQDDIERVEVMADENRLYVPEIEKLLEEHEADIYFQIEVKFSNKGSISTTMIPGAVMVVNGDFNMPLYMKADNIQGNIIVPAGERINVTFRSTPDQEMEILRDLREKFEEKNRRFKVVFLHSGGDRVESISLPFSSSLSENNNWREDLEDIISEFEPS